MNMLRSLGVILGLCVAAGVLAQPQDPSPDTRSPTGQTASEPGGPASDQVMPSPSRAAASTPDQANSATYPATTGQGPTDGRSSGARRSDGPPTQRGDPASAARNPDPGTPSSSNVQDRHRSATAGKLDTLSSGMDVQSTAGKPLGTVIDVISSGSGNPTYVIVADQSGNDAAILYATARRMVRENRLVVDDGKLSSAPKVPQSQLLDRARKDWQERADRYWNGPATHSAGSG